MIYSLFSKNNKTTNKFSQHRKALVSSQWHSKSSWQDQDAEIQSPGLWLSWARNLMDAPVQKNVWAKCSKQAKPTKLTSQSNTWNNSLGGNMLITLTWERASISQNCIRGRGWMQASYSICLWLPVAIYSFFIIMWSLLISSPFQKTQRPPSC